MVIVGICGGTGSGKTTVVKKLRKLLPQEEVAIIHLDSYYKDQSHLPLEERLKLNFDHPDSIEFSLLLQHLTDLRNGHIVQSPVYSYLTCTRGPQTVAVPPRHVLIIEGIMLMILPEVREQLDIKIFVDAEADVRLIRCIQRDMEERGRNVEEVLDRYQSVVKPMHDQFIEPQKRFSDLIIPQGGENHVAIKVLANTIKQVLKEKSERESPV